MYQVFLKLNSNRMHQFSKLCILVLAYRTFFNLSFSVTIQAKLRPWVSGQWWHAFKASLVRRWVVEKWSDWGKFFLILLIFCFAQNQSFSAAFSGRYCVGKGRLELFYDNYHRWWLSINGGSSLGWLFTNPYYSTRTRVSGVK